MVNIGHKAVPLQFLDDTDRMLGYNSKSLALDEYAGRFDFRSCRLRTEKVVALTLRDQREQDDCWVRI